jgi:Tfp pilus assembly protein PilN
MKNGFDIFSPKSLVIIFIQVNKDSREYTCVSQKIGRENIGELQVYNSLEEILKKFGNSRAYWLHVDGSGVLTRLVSRPSGYKEDLILNGDKNDFMFTSFTDGEQSVVSFFRRSILQQEFAEIESKKAHLMGVSSGMIPSIAGQEGNAILRGEFILQLRNGNIGNFERNTDWDGSLYVEKLVGGISILQKAGDDRFETGLHEDERKRWRSNYKDQKRFNTLGIVSVSILLVIVFVNYFYINYLNVEIAQLETELALSNENLALLDRFEGERNRKLQLIENSGFLGGHYTSYFMDQLGKSVPSSITLETMIVFPLQESLKEKRKVQLNTERIEIVGQTPDNEVLDDWLERINRCDWVKSVELVNYLKGTSGYAQFKLIVMLEK